MPHSALLLRQNDGRLTSAVEPITAADLPDGDVLIDVHYSSLNYKDAMAIAGQGIIRQFPAVPGIDLAGTVRESTAREFAVGDPVILTGWGIGERRWGGYAQLSRAPAAWLVPLPDGMSLAQAMQIGTAGLTAMLAVMALEEPDGADDRGEVLVSGATGGVGSIAVALLAARGYRVTALTRRPELGDQLAALGASAIVALEEHLRPKRPGRFALESERYAGAVDTVGGQALAATLARTRTGGAVAACGLVGGADLDTTVYPFILRGVRLLGIDSVMCPADRRRRAWARLATELALDRLAPFCQQIALADVPAAAARMLEGKSRGRTVVALRPSAP